MADNHSEEKPDHSKPWEAKALVRSIKQVLKEFETREATGVKDTLGYTFSRWPILNQDLSGLRPGTLTLVGSWKGFYRKEFLMEWCSQVTQFSRRPSLYQSFEFSARELILTRIATESNLPYGLVATGKLLGNKRRKEQLQSGLHNMASYQSLLHFSSGLRTADMKGLEEEISRIGEVFNGSYPTIFVDRLNAMETEKSSNDEDRLCLLARQLKFLALKYSVPIVAGVDFNRSPEEIVNGDHYLAEGAYLEQMTGGSSLLAEADHSFTLTASEADSQELVRLLTHLAHTEGLTEMAMPYSEVVILGRNEAEHPQEQGHGTLFLISYDTGMCAEICSLSEQEIIRFSRLEKMVTSMAEKGVWNFPESQNSVSKSVGEKPAGDDTSKVKVSVKLT